MAMILLKQKIHQITNKSMYSLISYGMTFFNLDLPGDHSIVLQCWYLSNDMMETGIIVFLGW